MLMLLLLITITVSFGTRANIHNAAIRVQHSENSVKTHAETFQVVAAVHGWRLGDHLDDFVVGVFICLQQWGLQPKREELYLGK
jgi:hypothetical protein